MGERKLGVAVDRVLEMLDRRTPAALEARLPEMLTALEGVVRVRFRGVPSGRRPLQHRGNAVAELLPGRRGGGLEMRRLQRAGAGAEHEAIDGGIGERGTHAELWAAGGRHAERDRTHFGQGRGVATAA